MRRTLLAGAAFGALLAAAPAIDLAPPTEPAQRRGVSADDPLGLALGVCDASGALETRRGLFVSAAKAWAQTMKDVAAEPVLIDGVASSAIDATVNDAARPWFEQGVGLLDGFNHHEAVRAFRKAQELDPDCAMCLWGEALALGPNINDPMDPAHNARAVAAAEAAKAKAGGANEVERALIDALQARYSADPAADRRELDMAFARAMQDVADRFPEHDHVQALTAEAIMDTQPWDYWEPGGREPKGMAGDALKRLETVLARNPDQVLAIHLHIHMTEGSDDPWRAVPYADRLGGLAPGSGHLVHMPAHVWYRIGRFADSLEANVEAVAVDEAYLAQAGDAASPIYRYGYYPHNVHFVLTSAQMAGDGETARDMAERLDKALPMEMANVEGWIQLIKAAPWFARAQFGDAESREALLDAPKPEGALPYVEAAWRYARGEAAARLGRPEQAREEAAALETLHAETDWASAIHGMPGEALVGIMRETVLARAAQAGGDMDAAIEHFGRATAMQADLPYLEPPFWYYPARQSFAAALLMDGQAERAEQEFFATLVESPDNGWAYWGLAQARKAQGDETGAEAAMTMWRDAWIGDEAPTLEEL